MSAERAAFAAALVLLVASAALALRAARFFVANDIRGVRNDLLGKARQEVVAEPSRPAAPRAQEPWACGDDDTTVVDVAPRGTADGGFVVVREELLLNSDTIIAIDGE